MNNSEHMYVQLHTMPMTRFTIVPPAPGSDDPTVVTDHALGLVYCDFESEAQVIRAIDALEKAREADPSIPLFLDVDFFALWTIAGQLLDPDEWTQPEPEPEPEPKKRPKSGRSRAFTFHGRH